MEGRSERTRTLAPYVALAALLPLALLLRGGVAPFVRHMREAYDARKVVVRTGETR